jgi:hypothetical protein
MGHVNEPEPIFHFRGGPPFRAIPEKNPANAEAPLPFGADTLFLFYPLIAGLGRTQVVIAARTEPPSSKVCSLFFLASLEQPWQDN